MYEYAGVRRVNYGIADGSDAELYFIPVCPICQRFVKADESVVLDGLGNYVSKPNATCEKCGRVEMPCEGYF